MFRCILRLFVFVIICVVVIFLINFWLQHKSFVFDENVIAKIGEKHAVKDSKPTDLKLLFGKVYKELNSKYQGHLLHPDDQQWLFMNAGGWMASMCVLHASVTEYVLFFGTALDTTGHSGRYWANITDTVLTGEFHQWKEGEFSSRIHRPGDTVKHVSGEVTSVHFKAGMYALEYGRGFLPSTLSFVVSDTIFSTHDFVTLFHILRIYAKSLVMEAGYYMAHPQEIFGN